MTNEFLTLAIKDQAIDIAKLSPKNIERFVSFTALCLRANIARRLLGESHRAFCARLADSPMLQWFLHLEALGAVKGRWQEQQPAL